MAAQKPIHLNLLMNSKKNIGKKNADRDLDKIEKIERNFKLYSICFCNVIDIELYRIIVEENDKEILQLN